MKSVIFLSLLSALSLAAKKEVIDIGKNTVDGKGAGPGLNYIEKTAIRRDTAIAYVMKKMEQMEKRYLVPTKEAR